MEKNPIKHDENRTIKKKNQVKYSIRGSAKIKTSERIPGAMKTKWTRFWFCSKILHVCHDLFIIHHTPFGAIILKNENAHEHKSM